MIARFASIALISSLAACGSVASLKNSDQTDFVILSQSEAGLIYKLFSGSVQACKLSKHGVTGLDYEIELDGGKCRATARK